MSGSLNGFPLLRAALTMPRWGLWWADVVVASAEVLSGSVELELGGLTLRGTIRSGGVVQDEGRYRIVAGADGWAKDVEPRPYRSAGGVRLATVLRDAAQAAGEQLGAVDEQKRIGGAFERLRGPASLVLDELVSEAWYVDNAGVTQIGTRPVVDVATPYTVMGTPRIERSLVTVAADDLTQLVPGARLAGIEVASWRHELTPTTLRSHGWGRVSGDRLLDSFRKLVEWIMGRTFFLGSYEYRVRGQTGGFLDLDPARPSLGLPKLANVPMRTGVPGGGGSPMPGSSCLVRFVDGDPTRPFVADFEGEYGPAWRPKLAKLVGDDVELGDAQGRVIRDGDVVLLTNFQTAPGGGPVASTGPGLGKISLDITNPAINQVPGAPGVGHSRAKA